MEPLIQFVTRARSGDLEAYGEIVRLCERMVFAVALGVLRDRSLAEDAAQDAFVRAFRNLGDLNEAAAFPGWLRRIAVTSAHNLRRARRRTLLQVEEVPEVPILDEAEQSWNERQRGRLAAALLTLPMADRRLCDRRYHGGCSIAQLAREAGVDEAALRKRLQRIRDRLRKEIEMAEQHGVSGGPSPGLPARIVELLARPQLSEIPENPVGGDAGRAASLVRRLPGHRAPGDRRSRGGAPVDRQRRRLRHARGASGWTRRASCVTT